MELLSTCLIYELESIRRCIADYERAKRIIPQRNLYRPRREIRAMFYALSIS